MSNQDSLGLSLQKYLMASCLYYEWDLSIMSDEDYDALCKRLHNNWDTLEHMHKHLTSKDLLECGSGYSIDYPIRVKKAAIKWYEIITGRQLRF